MTEQRYTQLYWQCQSVGWGLFALLHLMLCELRGEHITLICIAGITTLAVIGLCLTHFFRFLIHRFRWQYLTIPQLLPRVVLVSVIISGAMYAFMRPFELFVFQKTIIYSSQSWLRGMLLFISSVGLYIALWSVLYFGFHYLQRYKEAEITQWKLEAALKLAELEVLKSQINPHFLFNSLNSIRALVAEDPEKSQYVITKLAAILRYTLKSSESETVALGEELSVAEDYLALEGIRFEKRLRTEVAIDEQALHVHIPPMMLMTLVENAIKHGISKHRKGGFVAIDVQVYDGYVYISVKNTGVLRNAEDADCEASAFQMPSLDTPYGIGLANTRIRLHLLYGEQAWLRLEQHFENVEPHVEAVAIIPLQRRETHYDHHQASIRVARHFHQPHSKARKD